MLDSSEENNGSGEEDTDIESTDYSGGSILRAIILRTSKKMWTM